MHRITLSLLTFTLTFLPSISQAGSDTAQSKQSVQPKQNSQKNKAKHELKGRVNLGWQLETTERSLNDIDDVVSNASRIGLIGSIPIEEMLNFVYQFEAQVDLANKLQGDSFSARNQYIGLRGDFGEVLIGRNDTLLKQSQGLADKFNDYAVDIKRLWKGENRIDKSITYKSSPYKDVQFGVMYQSQDSNDFADGLSYFVRYGDFRLKKSDVFFAIGADRDIKGFNIERVNGKIKYKGMNIGLGYQNQHNLKNGHDSDGVLANLAYPFKVLDHDVGIELQFQNLESDKAISFGLDYFFDGKNKFYIWYSDVNQRDRLDTTFFSIGVEYHFGHVFSEF